MGENGKQSLLYEITQMSVTSWLTSYNKSWLDSVKHTRFRRMMSCFAKMVPFMMGGMLILLKTDLPQKSGSKICNYESKPYKKHEK